MSTYMVMMWCMIILSRPTLSNLERLHYINPLLPEAAINETVAKITTFEGGTLVQRNAVFHDYLQNGVDINYYNGKETLVNI